VTVLTGECDGCGSKDGVLIGTGKGGTDYHCAKCIQDLALYDAAEQHMELLLGEALRAWVIAWGNNPQMMRLLGSIVGDAVAHMQQEGPQHGR